MAKGLDADDLIGAFRSAAFRMLTNNRKTPPP